MDTTELSKAPWVRFATWEVPAPERLEFWRAHVSAAVAPMDFRALRPDFHASMVRTTIGTLHVARMTATSHVVEPDTRRMGDRADDVAVHVILRGESAFCTGDGVRTLRSGQVLLHRGGQPYLRGFAENSRDVVIRIPSSVYAELTHGSRPSLPHVVDADGPAGACVTALGRLLDRATRSETSAKPDDSTVLELVSELVSGRRTSASARAHYAAAREVIERHLVVPGLSAAFVAARIGISERHLSRVFAAQNTTVPRFVRGLRLDRAHRMLVTADGRERLTVAEVARRCGFTSASRFSNSFVKRFGIRPADLARQARGLAAITG
ncbi:helix-turn-helix domain-containing protein [Streptomyces scopuliridis]